VAASLAALSRLMENAVVVSIFLDCSSVHVDLLYTTHAARSTQIPLTPKSEAMYGRDICTF